MSVMNNPMSNNVLAQNIQKISVPKNTCLENPIEVLSGNYEIIIEENAHAIIMESCANISENAISTMAHILLNKNSSLTYYKNYNNTANENGIHTSELIVKQKEHSHFISNVICMNSILSKISNNIHVYLEEEYAQCTLNGITFGKDKQQIEHKTIVEHLKPNGTSDEYYKAILNDKSKSSFIGKVIVSPGAIHTSAAQSNKTLLLSRSAEINTQPELEIFSDDVKCTHGATVGQLDEEALFYLQARGIDKTEAQRLLIDAFLSDVLARMPLFCLEP